jgi:hypothetical protein
MIRTRRRPPRLLRSLRKVSTLIVLVPPVHLLIRIELETKELKLLDLIQSLGEYLNHEEPPLRGKGSCPYTLAS